jgi:hypothetical protein
MARPQLAESSCLFLLERESRGENETKGYDTLCIYGISARSGRYGRTDRRAHLHYQPSVQYFSTHNVLRHNTFCLSSAACAHAYRRTADESESIPTCNQFSTCVIQNDLCHMLYIYKRRRHHLLCPALHAASSDMSSPLESTCSPWMTHYIS